MKTKFVSDTLTLPANAAQSTEFGIDLDGDEQGRPDNALGAILATLAGQGVDLQLQVDEGIAMGELVILHVIQADDFIQWLTAGWQVYLGVMPATPPTFSGQDMFTVDPAGPTDAVLPGRITGGRFEGGPASVTIKLALTDAAPPLILELIGARVEADVTATTVTNAKLGGAITQDDINNEIIPNVADLINATIADDPGCMMVPPMCGSSAQTLLDLFDTGIDCTAENAAEVCPAEASMCDVPAGMTDGKCACGAAACDGNLSGDGVISVTELVTNDLLASILSPDVDLLDASGNFNPRQDGVKDSLSLGVGFSCVNAVFDEPAP